MTAFSTIDRRRVAYCIAIEGVPYRFCDLAAPGTNVTAGRVYYSDGTTARAPVDLLDAVLDVGAVEARIDDVAPVAGQPSVTVVIRSTDARTLAGARIDPRDYLMRVAGPASSTRRVNLLTALTHAPALTGATTIEVTKDVSGWTLPGVIHLGHEVIWADAATGTGTGANPYRFTGCVRGADNWVSQEHPVDTATNERPVVTSDVTTWRGRHATIHVAALDGGGVAIDWECYWEGVIESVPTCDGPTCTLRIAPMSAVAAYKLGVGPLARTAKSVAGAHQFRVGKCDRLDLILRADVTGFTAWASAADGATGVVTMEAATASALDVFGRAPVVSWEVNANAQREFDASTAWANPDLQFPAASGLAQLVESEIAASRAVALHARAGGQFVGHCPLLLVDPTTGVDDQVVAWPRRLLDVINTPQTWQTVIACWADPDDGGRQKRMVHASLAPVGGSWALIATIPTDGPWSGVVDVATLRGSNHCVGGWLIGEAADDVRGEKTARRFATQSIAWSEPVSAHETMSPSQRYVHQGPAAWWYQSGEPYIGPFSADVYTGAGGKQQIEVTGSGDPVRMWINGSTSATHPETGETVYWYAVVNPDNQRTIVQLPSDPPLSVQVVAAAYDSSPGAYMLKLLVSGTGDSDNSVSYDVMPIGCNLPTRAVDFESFVEMAAPGPLLAQDYEAVRGKSIAEQCGGLLLASGVQIASVYDNTLDAWQLALVPMGALDVRASVLTLTDDDLEARNGRDPVTTEIDGRTVRSYVVKLNYSGDTAEEVNVSCAVETNAAGSDSGQPLVIDLPGVRVTSAGGRAQAAAEIIADARTRVGVPRIRWRCAIRADMPGAIAIGVGSVVTLTSNYARGIDPTTSASGTVCRVVGFKRDLEANRLELELRPFSAYVGGWAQSAVVTATPTANTLTVDADTYSSADASSFSAGDVVNIFAPGDWANRVKKTVTSVSGNTLTIVGHGASVGDIISARIYGQAQASQRTWAYIADSDGLLGTDAGQVIG